MSIIDVGDPASRFEKRVKDATQDVLNRLVKDIERNLLSIFKRQRLAGNMTEEQLGPIMDKAMLSLTAWFIVHSVHPLARDAFVQHLAEGVKKMGEEQWKAMGTTKSQ